MILDEKLLWNAQWDLDTMPDLSICHVVICDALFSVPLEQNLPANVEYVQNFEEPTRTLHNSDCVELERSFI